MKIKIKLKDIIKSNEAIEKTGVDPWCVSEGADGEEYVTVKISNTIHDLEIVKRIIQ
jgi:hypothetical protein